MLKHQNGRSMLFGKLDNASTHQVREGLISMGDLAPTVDALPRGQIQALLTAIRVDRYDPHRAQLGRLLDPPFEALKPDQGHQQRDPHGRFGDLEFLHNAKPYGAFMRFHDLAQIEARAIADFVLLPGLRAQDAGEVLGLIAVEHGLAAAHVIHKKTSPGHNGLKLILCSLICEASFWKSIPTRRLWKPVVSVMT